MKFICLLIILVSSRAFSKTLSPTFLANLAQERAPLIKAHVEEQLAARSQISQSKLLANPILTIQSGGLKSGTQFGSVYDFTVNQPIPWPGRRQAEINSAKILEKISETDLEESKLLVHHSVTLLSLELASLQELEKHNKERNRRFSIIQRFLRTRPLASPIQKVEKNLIETQLKLIETQMFDIETKKKSVALQLQQLTGEEDLQIEMDWSKVPELPSKDVFASALENGPEFRRVKRMEELAANRIEQAKYQARPDILIGANYRQENVAPVNHFYHANLSVVIPIIDRGQHAVETARANARREEANKRIVQLNQLATLNRSYQILEASFAATKLFNVNSLKKSEAHFGEAEDAFKKGRIDVTTFLQSDMQIHDSIDLAYLSFIKYYTALSEIKMLTGEAMVIP